MSNLSVAINHRKLSNATIFYREAGLPLKPTLLLLHGFPTSSHMFRNMMPILAKDHHVIAPDLPGFGFTTVNAGYKYTFADLASTIAEFLDALKIMKFSMYVFDYGAPVGLRLALARPNAVTALITQNGNAYTEGLGDVWSPIKQYWKTGSEADAKVLRENMLTYEGTKSQYVGGELHPEQIAPESWTLDHALLSREGNQDIQLSLFKDYETNVDLYPKFQEWFRARKLPTLVVWGKNDPFFIPPGAEAFKKDLPEAEVHLLDAGHFAGETHTEEIGQLILKFLKAKGV